MTNTAVQYSVDQSTGHKQPAAAAPAPPGQLNHAQTEQLVHWATANLKLHPDWQSWAPEQRTQAITQHVYELAAMPHYLEMVGYVPQNHPAQPQAKAHTPLIPQEGSPKEEPFDLKSLDAKKSHPSETTPVTTIDEFFKKYPQADQTKPGRIITISSIRPNRSSGK